MKRRIVDISRRAPLDVEKILKIHISPAAHRGDEDVRAEINQYIRDSAERGPFVADLLMQAKGTTPDLHELEVGSSPYVITRYLLAAMPSMHLVAVDHPDLIWPGPCVPPEKNVITIEMPDSSVIEVPHWMLNAERDSFPFEDKSFDAVICTDTLEHLLFSPTHLLCEVHRVLRIGAVLVFTVPNSLNLKYLAAQLFNRPTLHQYTGYGVYGGHRREYSLQEVCDLLRGCGFRVERAFTKNFRVPSHGNRKTLLASMLARISNLPLPYLANKREHIVAIGQSSGDVAPYYPLWLYKSMHLAWMKQTYPDLNDSWLRRHEEKIACQPLY